MYQWLWSKLPGGRALKLALSMLLLAAVIAVLFTLVFPALDLWFAQNPIVSQ